MLKTNIRNINLNQIFTIKENESQKTLIKINGYNNTYNLTQKRGCYNYAFKFKKGTNFLVLYTYENSTDTNYIFVKTSEIIEKIKELVMNEKHVLKYSNVDYIKELIKDNNISDLIDFITDIYSQIKLKYNNKWWFIMNIERIKKPSDFIEYLNINYNNYQLEKRKNSLKVSDISKNAIKRYNRQFDYNRISNNCRTIYYEFTIDKNLKLIILHEFNFLNNMFKRCKIFLENKKYNEILEYQLDSLNDLIKSPQMIYHLQQPCNLVINDKMIWNLSPNKKQISKLFELQLIYNRINFNPFDFNFKVYNRLINRLKKEYDYKISKNYYTKRELKSVIDFK